MHRNLLMAALTLAISTCAPAFAQEAQRQILDQPLSSPARVERIEAMLTATGLKDRILQKLQTDQKALEFAARREVGAAVSKLADAETNAARDRYLLSVDRLKARLDWLSIREPILAQYGQAFSDPELIAITRFFETAPGKSLRDHQEGAMQGTERLIADREKEMLPVFQGMTKDFQGAIAGAVTDPTATTSAAPGTPPPTH